MVIDKDGYRANVGVIIINDSGQVLWARRIGQDAWQFPQGGMHKNESPKQALYREIKEEVGLEAKDVSVLGCTENWLRYRLPDHLIRRYARPVCIGQKQKWFLAKLVCSEQKIRLDLSHSPEFDSWQWVHYWHPIEQVIEFKREVYQQALSELADKFPASLGAPPGREDSSC